MFPWPRARMTDDCGYRLTSFEPIVEGMMRLEYHADGWALWVRHRHYGGAFMDCEPFEVTRLTTGELMDVLPCVVAGWGSTGAGVSASGAAG